MRRALLVPIGLLVSGALLGACDACDTDEDRARNKISELAEVDATSRGLNEEQSGRFAGCMLDRIRDIDKNDDRSLLFDIWTKTAGRTGSSALRQSMVDAGVSMSLIDESFAACDATVNGEPTPATDPADTEAPAPVDTAAPAPTAPQTTVAAEAFPDLLLRLVEASTDGMVPPDKQECYRNALLAALPQGENTAVTVPASVTKNTLQEVLAGLGISVQQQGELLGKCMMG